MHGKVAIVTGSHRHRARAIALHFAAGGASVLACGIDVAAKSRAGRRRKKLSVRVEGVRRRSG